MITIFLFIIFFGLLVLIHEFGHFYAAKKSGIKVEEFGIGFPPRIFKWRRKETLYSVGLIPFGGFVKLEGELSEDKGFRQAPPFKKFIVAFAGIFLNIVLSYVIFSLALLTIGLPSLTSSNIRVIKILPNTLGDKYFKPGDIISKAIVDNKSVYFDSAVSFIRFIKTHLGQSVIFEIFRNNQKLDINITLPNIFDSNKGALGIMISNYSITKTSFPKNFLISFKYIATTINNIFFTINLLLAKILGTGSSSVNIQIVGPIGIYSLFSNLLKIDFTLALHFLGEISIYLAILNLLPFPGLDGFHLVLALLEKIRGKRLNIKTEEKILIGGMALLFLLLIVVTFNDITKLLK